MEGTMRNRLLVLAVLLGAAPSPATAADQAQPLGALARMPVRELTVFKDGHALVLHEGRMPLAAGGQVAMDYLPNPVLAPSGFR